MLVEKKSIQLITNTQTKRTTTMNAWKKTWEVFSHHHHHHHYVISNDSHSFQHIIFFLCGIWIRYTNIEKNLMNLSQWWSILFNDDDSSGNFIAFVCLLFFLYWRPKNIYTWKKKKKDTDETLIIFSMKWHNFSMIICCYWIQ